MWTPPPGTLWVEEDEGGGISGRGGTFRAIALTARMVGELEKMEAEEKVNILLVDDTPAKLMALEAILAELGQNLVKARSEKEALGSSCSRSLP